MQIGLFKNQIQTVTNQWLQSEPSQNCNTEARYLYNLNPRPYSSWERGLNENTNGLVRQYLKKGSSFDSITDEYLKIIMDKLNDRPRKTLDFQSPNMLFLPQTDSKERVVALAG